MAYRFRSVLHRVLSQTQMEVGVLDSQNAKDDSRPNFPRPEYTIGIYIDALDARPDKSTTVGSQHAFMMAVMDKLLDYLRTIPLRKVKGELAARQVASGVILEGFKNGCVLAVTFDDVAALNTLWALHEKRRLSALFQDVLVDRSTLKAVCASKLTLRAKLWHDEVTACKLELEQRAVTRQKLTHFEHDVAEVRHMKNFQKKTMPDLIAHAREHENNVETQLGDFMLTVKQSQPSNTTVIKTSKEFANNMKMAKGLKPGGYGFDSIDKYLAAIEFYRKTFAEVQVNLIHPLIQIRGICETEKQKNLKTTIKDACAEMINNLRPEADLQKIRFNEWSQKMVKREHGLFFGLISLVPMSLDRLSTIDVSVDDYIADFPELNAS